MKNQREIYQALLDGKKLKCRNQEDTAELSEEGYVIDEEGCRFSYWFDNPHNWQIVQEPKTIKLEAWLIERDDGNKTLIHYSEGSLIDYGDVKSKKRVPSEDKTVTLEEE